MKVILHTFLYAYKYLSTEYHVSFKIKFLKSLVEEYCPENDTGSCGSVTQHSVGYLKPFRFVEV